MTMSLFSLCLNFVASNIQLVESFIGFPETVGIKIFEEAAKKKQFKGIKKNGAAKSNLKLFFDAYGDKGILESLCLQCCHLFINDALFECPWILKDLTCLDLSFCGLGDNHELLPKIVSLHSLKVLSLKSNVMSDDGVRQLTAPLRFHERSHCLKYIDLSLNDITAKSIRFLKCFTCLHVMVLSDTSISKQTDSCQIGFNLSQHCKCSCLASVCHVTTDGWAKHVVNSWKEEYHEKNSSSQSLSFTSPSVSGKAAVINASTFYTKRKSSSVAPSSHVDDKDTTLNRFVLVTELFHCPQDSHEVLSQTVQSRHHSNRTIKNVAAHQSSGSNMLSTHQKHKINSPLQRQNAVELCESSSLHNRKCQQKVMKSNTFQKKKRMKLNGSNIPITENATLAERQDRKNANSDDILKFYVRSETNSLNQLHSDRKTKQEKKKKSALEELQEWT